MSEPMDNIKKWAEDMKEYDPVPWDMLPQIYLYMDQVITYMEGHLKPFEAEDGTKLLTSSMINNYVKDNVLPRPEQKKYSPEHMVLLLFIYYFKNFLSINDIQSILAPITKRFFHSENGRNLNTVYEEIFQRQYENIDFEVRDMIRKLRDSNKAFADIEDDEERKLLSNFAFICSLSFDIWVKKSVIESIIDKDMMDQKKSNSKKKN